jgi:hypothetical protein
MTDAERRGEALLEALLGPEPDPRSDDEPSSAELSACVAGEPLDAAVRERAERYLAGSPGLRDGLRAALEVFDEVSDEVSGSERVDADQPRAPLLSLADLRARRSGGRVVLEAPGAALAADDVAPPIPEDRHCLLADDRLSLVYFRRHGEGFVLLSGAAVRADEVRLDGAQLGEETLEVEDEAEGQRVKLGPLGPLDGRPLALVLAAGDERLEGRWQLAVSGLGALRPVRPDVDRDD